MRQGGKASWRRPEAKTSAGKDDQVELDAENKEAEAVKNAARASAALVALANQQTAATQSAAQNAARALQTLQDPPWSPPVNRRLPFTSPGSGGSGKKGAGKKGSGKKGSGKKGKKATPSVDSTTPPAKRKQESPEGPASEASTNENQGKKPRQEKKQKEQKEMGPPKDPKQEEGEKKGKNPPREKKKEQKGHGSKTEAKPEEGKEEKQQGAEKAANSSENCTFASRRPPKNPEGATIFHLKAKMFYECQGIIDQKLPEHKKQNSGSLGAFALRIHIHFCTPASICIAWELTVRCFVNFGNPDIKSSKPSVVCFCFCRSCSIHANLYSFLESCVNLFEFLDTPGQSNECVFFATSSPQSPAFLVSACIEASMLTCVRS